MKLQTRAAFLVLLAAGLSGCEGSPTAPTPTAQPLPSPPRPQPTSDVVPPATGGVAGFRRIDMVMSRTGTATVTLQWPDGDYSLQLYVTSGTCLDLTGLLTGMCTISGKTRPGDRPGVVASRVTSGDLNTIWVLNSDPAPQPFTVDVRIE
ncbi:MAG: hypothetical protein ABIS06_21600 [Vicinamibacterales bacterium]